MGRKPSFWPTKHATEGRAGVPSLNEAAFWHRRGPRGPPGKHRGQGRPRRESRPRGRTRGPRPGKAGRGPTLSESRSGSAWQRRKRKLLGSLQSVCRVVRKQVPPTFSRTHFPGSVAGGPPLDGAAPLEGLQRRKGAEGGRPRLGPPAGDAGSSQGLSVAILAQRRKVPPRKESPPSQPRPRQPRARLRRAPTEEGAGRGGRSLASRPAGEAGLPAAARSRLLGSHGWKRPREKEAGRRPGAGAAPARAAEGLGIAAPAPK